MTATGRDTAHAREVAGEVPADAVEVLAWRLILAQWGEHSRAHLEHMVRQYTATFGPWQNALQDARIALQFVQQDDAREVAELRAEVERLSDPDLRLVYGYDLGARDAEAERDAAVTRAERAEAKVAAVAALADEIWRDSQRDRTVIRDAGIMQDVVSDLRAALADPAADDDTEGTS